MSTRRTRARRRPAADEATLGLLSIIRRKASFINKTLHSNMGLHDEARITLCEITVDIIDAANDVAERLGQTGGA